MAFDRTEPKSFDELLHGIIDGFEKKINPNIVTFNDLWIRPKEGDSLINLGASLNHTQQLFLENKLEINPFEKFSLIRKRFIKLKARQLGFTTLACAIFFCDTVNNPLRYSAILADEEGNTKRIFEIIKRFYDNLPDEKKPETKYNTKTDLTFPGLDSQIFVGTAGAKNFGQGSTINNVLCSEVASYQNPESVVANILQAVPKSGNVFLESTAEGLGNFFHVTYEESEAGEGAYSSDFSPWFHDPEYKLPEPIVRDFSLTKYHKKIMSLYNLSMEQIYWYNSKERELKEIVKQEYPCSPEEAFLSAGGDFFPNDIINDYIDTAKRLKPLPFPGVQVLPLVYKELVAKRATLDIWVKPVPGHRYIITGDSSEGEEDTKSDFSSADIIDVDTWDVVGHLHGKLEPQILAKLMVELGYYYNKALLVPERNNHGHTVCNEIINHTNYGKMDVYGWGGLYYHLEYDASKRQQTAKPGYPTSSKTKIMALDALLECIVEKALGIPSYKSLVEMLNYKCLGKGKYGAPPGLKDDRVMSLAIGAYLLKNAPRANRPKQKSKQIKKGSYA